MRRNVLKLRGRDRKTGAAGCDAEMEGGSDELAVGRVGLLILLAGNERCLCLSVCTLRSAWTVFR